MRVLLSQSSRLLVTVAAAILLSACNVGDMAYKSEGSSADPNTNTAVGGVSNRAPAIEGIPGALVIAGATYSFQPTASDPDEDNLVFSIVNRPTWASFDSSTGRLSGTPRNRNAGYYDGIAISVSDGVETIALPSFSILVEPNIVGGGNTSGGDTSGGDTSGGSSSDGGTSDSDTSGGNTGGDTSGSDTSGDDNSGSDSSGDDTSGGDIPGGDTSGGNTSGNDTSGDDTSGDDTSGGDTAGGDTSGGSSPITGTASLSWVAPTTRVDGTPLSLSQIAGYRIYSGTSRNSLALVRDLDDGSATSYVITGLAAATTHYFAVSVYDADGNESGRSEVASKRIP